MLRSGTPSCLHYHLGPHPRQVRHLKDSQSHSPLFSDLPSLVTGILEAPHQLWFHGSVLCGSGLPVWRHLRPLLPSTVLLHCISTFPESTQYPQISTDSPQGPSIPVAFEEKLFVLPYSMLLRPGPAPAPSLWLWKKHVYGRTLGSTDNFKKENGNSWQPSHLEMICGCFFPPSFSMHIYLYTYIVNLYLIIYTFCIFLLDIL